jgi:hypothetical protein
MNRNVNLQTISSQQLPNLLHIITAVQFILLTESNITSLVISPAICREEKREREKQ